MSLDSDLRKEEFIQNYLQYRWLDDTRSKLIDRFFVVVVAVLAGRFQFAGFFEKTKGWALGLYLVLIFFSAFVAKSVVSFRRQQRGHGKYINGIRHKILHAEMDANEELKQYDNYLKGKRVYLTKWIEFIVVLFAILSPLLLLIDPVVKTGAGCILEILASFWCVIPVIALIAYLVGLPFYRYNFKKELDWNKD